MTIHALTEWLQYQWNAKSRHGIHSPFVYEFIEKVLLDLDPMPEDTPHLKLVSYNGKTPSHLLTRHYHKLPERVAVVYSYENLLVASTDSEDEPRRSNYLLINAEPRVWIRLFNHHLPLMPTGSCIMVADIHKTKRHTGKWKRICNHPKVRMSIDLYGVGILFFREEFKEKQHFVLRY